MESSAPPDASADAEPMAPSHRLASNQSPLERLKSHAQGLSGDVRAWLELRFELARIKLFEQLDEQLDQVVLFAIVGALGAVGGVVMLATTCFAISWFVAWIFGWLTGGTLGALTLGFGLVAFAFLTLAALVFALKPRFGFLEDKTRAVLPEQRVMQGRGAGERVAAGHNDAP